MTTQRLLEVNGTLLRSKVNGRTYQIGTLEMTSLADLRQRVAVGNGAMGKARVSIVQGDVRRMHLAPEYAGALFQVASQTNCLEMVGPSVRPEDGVTRYEHDRTQGPACAIAAGAATLYRNFFAPVGNQTGQTAERQLDGLADVGEALSAALGWSVAEIWQMRNGYCLPTRAALDLITTHLRAIGPKCADELGGKLRIGLHLDVEATEGMLPGPMVSQAFCSALPVAYGRHPTHHWAAFAQLVLNAAYEATLLQCLINTRRGGSNVVALTLLGGGAFGNSPEWIYAAIKSAVSKVTDFDLDIRLVSYGAPSQELHRLVAKLAS